MKIDCTQSNGMRNWIRKRIGRRVCRSLVFEFCSPLSEGGTRTGAGQGWRHIGKPALARRPSDFKSITWPEEEKTETKSRQGAAAYSVPLAPPQNWVASTASTASMPHRAVRRGRSAI
jgi:hypothetical protein